MNRTDLYSEIMINMISSGQCIDLLQGDYDKREKTGLDSKHSLYIYMDMHVLLIGGVFWISVHGVYSVFY